MTTPVLSDDTIEEIVYAVLGTGHVDTAKAAVRAVIDEAMSATASALAAPAPAAVGDVLRDGATLYALDENSVNLWSAFVQSPTLTREQREAIAANIQATVAQAPAEARIQKLECACRQARRALFLDAMIDESGQDYGTTTVALEAIAEALGEPGPTPLAAPRPAEVGELTESEARDAVGCSCEGDGCPACEAAPRPSAEAGRVGELEALCRDALRDLRYAYDTVALEFGSGVARGTIDRLQAALSGGAK